MITDLDIYLSSEFRGRILFCDSNSPDLLTNYQDLGKERSDKFYEKFYVSEVNPLAKTREIQFRKIFSRLEKIFTGSTRKVSIDIGCGKGEFVSFLESKLSTNWSCYGVEPALTDEKSNVKKMSLEEVGSGDILPQKYDFISLLDVFEHFHEPAQQIELIAQLMNHDGVLLLKVPNKEAFFYKIGKFLCLFTKRLAIKIFSGLYQVNYPPPHFFYYSATALKNVIYDKFEVMDVFYISECPFGGLWTRFWMLPKILRPIAILCTAFYRLFSIGKMNDALVLVARKK